MSKAARQSFSAVLHAVLQTSACTIAAIGLLFALILQASPARAQAGPATSQLGGSSASFCTVFIKRQVAVSAEGAITVTTYWPGNQSVFSVEAQSNNDSGKRVTTFYHQTGKLWAIETTANWGAPAYTEVFDASGEKKYQTIFYGYEKTSEMAVNYYRTNGTVAYTQNWTRSDKEPAAAQALPSTYRLDSATEVSDDGLQVMRNWTFTVAYGHGPIFTTTLTERINAKDLRSITLDENGHVLMAFQVINDISSIDTKTKTSGATFRPKAKLTAPLPDDLPRDVWQKTSMPSGQTWSKCP